MSASVTAAVVGTVAGVNALTGGQITSMLTGQKTPAQAAQDAQNANIAAGGVAAANAKAAGNIQATAATQAGDILAGGATTAGDTLAAAAPVSAQQMNAGLQQGIDTTNAATDKIAANLQPTIGAGTQALTSLSTGLQAGGQFNKPFTMADAQNTDAYKFALQEGKTAINNASAAGGTQLSSANVEAQGKMATGLAASTEQQAFNQWLSSNNMTLGALQNAVKTGQISTEQLNQQLAQAGVSTATAQTAMGSNTAAGTMGSAQAKATEAQNVSSAKAGGVTGAANANAAGLTGVGNIVTNTAQTNANLNTAQANANASNVNSGLSTLASGLTAFANKPNAAPALVAPVNTAGTVMNSQSNVSMAGTPTDSNANPVGV
jgi:hypothetical protein